jgi:hypothetical protein
MKINLNFLYLAPIILVCFTDNLFYLAIFGEGNGETDKALANTIAGISFLVPLLLFKTMTPAMRTWYFIVCGAFAVLMMESYYLYGTPFKYPHVFSKITKFYVIFFIYTFYKKYDKLRLDYVIYAIIIAFVLNVSIVNREALSLSSFSKHERGLWAESVYFLLLPCLYFFNKYLLGKKQVHLLLFFLFFGFIIFFQHRTVWMCSIVALTANLFLVNWRSDVKFNMNSFIPIAFYSTVGAIVLVTFIFAAKPEIVKKLVENIEDIQNYKSQGTGEWRYRQYLSYKPFIEDNILIGMRFQGFELPIQFYEQWDENTERPYFDDNTGHHIHSNYIDTLFYFGIAGLFLFYIPAFVYFFTRIRKKRLLNMDQVVLISFCTTIFAYSYSYTWPFWSYTVVGMLAVLLEKNLDSAGEETKAKVVPQFKRGNGRVPVSA